MKFKTSNTMITNTVCVVLVVLFQVSVFHVHGQVASAWNLGMQVPDVQNAPTPNPKQVIESFHVQTDIRYRFATTKMCSIVRNTAGTANEMSFHVTLPKKAFIVSFAMTIDGKVYDGEVKEKKAAKEQYHQAVLKGQSAGHIRQTPRHSNRFDMSVNVANGTAVNFTLIYQQILSRKLGVYDYDLHVEPGEAVDDFKVEVFIQENRPLLFVKTPQIRRVSVKDNSIRAPDALTTVELPTETTAHIQYMPTVSQQGPGGLSTRFVVQYDIEHSDNGDVLVADGYFIHLFTPKPQSDLPKDIIFVLDLSGSMTGDKIAQLKGAMKAILDDLTEDDRFNILTFSNNASPWKMVLQQVTSSIVEEAKLFVSNMKARGGTNINDALLTALTKLKSREVKTRVGMVFFLTDGEPTVGESNPSNIAMNVKRENSDDTFIYSLAFGAGANFESLKTISTQNNGYARKIYEASDAALQVELLYDEISTVAMKNVSVKYLPTVSKTTETVFPIIQNGTEIMIGGCIDLRSRLPNDGIFNSNVFEAEIEGTENEGTFEILLEVDDIDEITIDPEDSLNTFFTMPRDYSGIVEKMWAFLTIQQMLREKQGVVDEKNKVDDLDKKILEMSLKYKFVTPLTSMVVTKPDTDSPVESGLEDVDMQSKESSFGTYNSQSRASFPMRSQSNRRAKTGRKFYNPVAMQGLSGIGGSSGLVSNHPGRSSGQLFNHLRGSSGPVFNHPLGSSGPVFNHPGGPSIDMDVTGSNGIFSSGSVAKVDPVAKIPAKPRKKATSNKKSRRRVIRKKKGKKASPFGVIKSIVLIVGPSSLCLELRKTPPGKYLLAEAGNMSRDLTVELETGCLKKCKIVVPMNLILNSSAGSTTIDLTSLTSWKYQHHSDFDVMFAKMNGVIFDHSSTRVSLERVQNGKKVIFSIEIHVKNIPLFSSSGMTHLVGKALTGKRRRRPRVPKACLNANAHMNMYLKKKKALKYKV